MRAGCMPADFRATGHTGILCGGSGLPLVGVSAVVISGAIEQLSPPRDDDGWELIAGQGSLFHPSFAGVSTGLLHGAQPDALLLCHDPVRPHMRGLPHYPMPGLRETLDANLQVARPTNPPVRAVGVAPTTHTPPAARARRLCPHTPPHLGPPHPP